MSFDYTNLLSSQSSTLNPTKLKEKVQLSAIISTRNRAKQLANLFQCLGLQKDIENLNFEIVIVDNNSSDNTKEVAYAFCEGSNLKVNYLFEEKTGLSNARNAGILASKGSYLIFIDDDVLLPKDFFSRVLFGLEEYPEFHIFGYKVLPDWQEARSPFWLSFKRPFNLSQSFLPIHDLGGEPLSYPNRKSRNPLGACFLAKKEVFEKLGPFRDDLGAGTQSGLHEDSEFFWRSMANGFKLLYWPYAFVYHPVDPKRLSVSYLHKWYFNSGKSLYLIKNTGGVKREIRELENWRIGNENKELKKLFQALSTRKNIPVFLFFKLFLLILLLPASLFLLLIKRPFYFSTLLLRNIGEISQVLKVNKQG